MYRPMRGIGWVVLGTALLGAALPPMGCGERTDVPLPSSQNGHIRWETKQVLLEADDFHIDVNGKTYKADVVGGTLNSDPGHENYCTLEAIWREHDTEMRLFIYFVGDATHWWSDEARTYDGQAQGDWIFYRNPFPRTARGQAFTGDLTLKSEPGGPTGQVHFKNLHLEACR
jgi:hypothetical protein